MITELSSPICPTCRDELEAFEDEFCECQYCLQNQLLDEANQFYVGMALVAEAAEASNDVSAWTQDAERFGSHSSGQ